jgi:hypothetical protein
MVRRTLLALAALTLSCVVGLPAPSFAHGGGGHGGGGHGGGHGGFGHGGFGHGGFGHGGFGHGGFGYGYGFGLGFGYGYGFGYPGYGYGLGYPGYGYGYPTYDYGLLAYPCYGGLNGTSVPSYYGYANAAPLYRDYYAATAPNASSTRIVAIGTSPYKDYYATTASGATTSGNVANATSKYRDYYAATPTTPKSPSLTQASGTAPEPTQPLQQAPAVSVTTQPR